MKKLGDKISTVYKQDIKQYTSSIKCRLYVYLDL